MSKNKIRFKDLTKAQQIFIENNALERELTIPEWLNFLTPVCRYDETSDAKKSTLLVALKVLAVIFALLSIVLWVTLFDQFPFIMVIIILFWVIVPSISAMAMHSLLKNKDLDNNIRNFILPFLKALSLEVGHKNAVYLKVNFNKSLNNENKIRTERDNRRAPYTQKTFFMFDVLELRTRFPDETQLQISIIDRVEKRIRCRRRSGKTKYKTKIKNNRRIRYQLKFNKSTYKANTDRVMTDEIRQRFQTTDRHLKYSGLIKQKASGIKLNLSTKLIIDALAEPYPYIKPKGKTT